MKQIPKFVVFRWIEDWSGSLDETATGFILCSNVEDLLKAVCPYPNDEESLNEARDALSDPRSDWDEMNELRSFLDGDKRELKQFFIHDTAIGYILKLS